VAGALGQWGMSGVFSLLAGPPWAPGYWLVQHVASERVALNSSGGPTVVNAQVEVAALLCGVVVDMSNGSLAVHSHLGQ